ncbi:hypothetical protein BURPS305_6003 [Burkholderia pseudomallei 305]|nr:hypothetical protein BURPS305_6003 [Burkholderia pseudomallei 305]
MHVKRAGGVTRRAGAQPQPILGGRHRACRAVDNIARIAGGRRCAPKSPFAAGFAESVQTDPVS